MTGHALTQNGVAPTGSAGLEPAYSFHFSRLLLKELTKTPLKMKKSRLIQANRTKYFPYSRRPRRSAIVPLCTSGPSKSK